MPRRRRGEGRPPRGPRPERHSPRVRRKVPVLSRCARGRGARARVRVRNGGRTTPSEQLSGCWRITRPEEDARRRAEELNGEDEEDADADQDREKERERRRRATRRARRVRRGSSERDRRAAGLKRASTKRMVTLDGRGGLDGELVRVGGGGGGGAGAGAAGAVGRRRGSRRTRRRGGRTSRRRDRGHSGSA